MAQEKLPEFRMCACGLHGRVVRADDGLEMEVYSQKLARISLGVAIQKGRVETRHGAEVARQIYHSGLPPSNDDIPEKLRCSVGEWNEVSKRRPSDQTPPCLAGEGS